MLNVTHCMLSVIAHLVAPFVKLGKFYLLLMLLLLALVFSMHTILHHNYNIHTIQPNEQHWSSYWAFEE